MRGEGSDLRPHGAARFDVKADGGLVKEDEVGVAGEGESKEHTLLLAAGELTEEAVFEAFERGGPDEVRGRHGVFVVAAEHGDVFADTEHLRRGADLQHDPGAEAGGALAGVRAEDANRAGGWGAETHEQLDRGGLARAVGAKQRDDLAAMQGEGEIIERDDAVTVAAGDVE